MREEVQVPRQADDFRKLYAKESLLLAEVLKDADEGLAKELVSLVFLD